MVYSEAQGLIEGPQGILFGSVLKCFQSRDRLVILQGEGEGEGECSVSTNWHVY